MNVKAAWAAQSDNGQGRLQSLASHLLGLFTFIDYR